jgi:hypothetical protein
MIRRRTWITLGAFGFVLLLAWAWTRSGDRLQDQPAATASPAPLWEVEGEDIQGLRLEDGQGNVLLAVERDPKATWVLLEPVQGAADAGRMERAITWLRSPQLRGAFEAEEPLAAYQLDPPSYQIILLLRDGSRRAFSVGRPAPTGGVTYARYEGISQVLLMGRSGVEDVLALLDPLPLELSGMEQSTPAGGVP